MTDLTLEGNVPIFLPTMLLRDLLKVAEACTAKTVTRTDIQGNVENFITIAVIVQFSQTQWRLLHNAT